MTGSKFRLSTFFKNLNIRLKITLTLDLLALLLCIFMGVYIYNFEKKSTINELREYSQILLKQVETTHMKFNPSSESNLNTIINIINSELLTSPDLALNAETRGNLTKEIRNNLLLSLNNRFEPEYNDLLDKVKLLESGQAFVVREDGYVLFHPSIQGKDITERLFFNQMITSGKNQGLMEYRWPEARNGIEKILFYRYNPVSESYYCLSFNQSDISHLLKDFRERFIWAIVIVILLFSILNFLILKPIVGNISKLISQINDMADGRKYTKITYPFHDEIGSIVDSLNKLSNGLSNAADFAKKMGEGDLEAEFAPMSEEDQLGNALLEMRKSLIKNRKEDMIRKAEDDKRSWTNQGIAKFNDIIRNSSNMSELGDQTIINMVDYLDANQGSLFIINDEDKNHVLLELIAAYAFDRKKHIKKQIEIGEGLAGQCAKEKKTIYMKEVPDNYVEITSGLGTGNPREILIVPLSYEDKILGVIELASFNSFEDYQIQFVEKIAETLASSISAVRINEQTSHLLEQSRVQSEELASREEELRQNMEEMAATQEESQRREQEMAKELEKVKQELEACQVELKKKS
jgi:hypothetical protein